MEIAQNISLNSNTNVNSFLSNCEDLCDSSNEFVNLIHKKEKIKLQCAEFIENGWKLLGNRFKNYLYNCV